MTTEQLQKIASQLRKPDGEDGIKTGEWMSHGNVHIIHDTLDLVDAGTNDNILEIGMGSGFYVPEILAKSPDIQYTGCDYSELMIMESSKLNSKWVTAGRAKFIHGDIFSLPFTGNVFDKVFTINTIYFWDDNVKALLEISSVLKPGGRFIIGFRPKHQTEKIPFTKYGFNQYSKTEIADLLAEHCFNTIDCIENEEPPLDLNGQTILMRNIVIVAMKEREK